LTPIQRLFDSSLFRSLVPENDLYTNADVTAAAGAQDMAAKRCYIWRAKNMIERIEVYLNTSYVGQIPQIGTQMSFEEHMMIGSILNGSGPLPKPAASNNVIPATQQRFDFWRFLNNILHEDWVNTQLASSAANVQSTFLHCISIGEIIASLGLPGHFLTGNILTFRVRFKTDSTHMMNACMYANPSLGNTDGTNSNSDRQVIASTDNTVALVGQAQVVYDKLSDSRATLTRDINYLQNINRGKNVYRSLDWVSEQTRNVQTGNSYSLNVNINAGMSPKWVVAYFKYDPTFVQPADFGTGFLTLRNICTYKPPTLCNIQFEVSYNYKNLYSRDVQFGNRGNAACHEMYRLLQSMRPSYGGEQTTFSDYVNFYPILIAPITKSMADINIDTQSSLDNGVVQFKVSLSGGIQWPNNITLVCLVMPEVWNVRDTTISGVTRMTSNRLIQNGYLMAGQSFADQNRAGIAQSVGITPQMLRSG